MILKIDTNNNKKDTLNFNDYWIFGEIERIHYNYWKPGGVSFLADLELYCSEPSDYNLEEGYITFNKDEEKNILQLNLKFNDPKKDTYSIFLQGCICYLCNDEGKTIDKLVC